MKRILLFTLGIFITIVIFSIGLFFINRSSGKGALQVTSDPESKVYLSGKLLGETPLCKGVEGCELKDMILSGDYELRLVPSEGNFEPFEQKIQIFPKVLTVVDRSFAQGPNSSASIITLKKLTDKNEIGLSIVSIPGSAKVYIDNNLSGETPLNLENITESDHELKLTKEGYKEKSIRIRSVKGFKLEALVFLGLSEAAISPATPPTSTTPVVSKVLILKTPTGFLRVRDNPSLGGNQIGQVLPDEKYDFISEQNGWFEIKLKDGKTGWVSGQYSKKE